jgi:hypothetical protein
MAKLIRHFSQLFTFIQFIILIQKIIPQSSLTPQETGDLFVYVKENCPIPLGSPLHHIELANSEVAVLRLLLGLQFILKTDFRPILQMTKLNYLHFVGEESQLVNHNNVHVSSSCQLVQVPQAGMRVLQDNLMH